MYSFLVARIKPADNYQFFTYEGKRPVPLDFRGKEILVTKGQKFGVRKSANKKAIRLILDDDVNRVFTISLDQARDLAKHV
jgi:hypothetical protein